MEIKALSVERQHAPRFLLTADELHVVQERVPTLLLPPRFTSDAGETAEQPARRPEVRDNRQRFPNLR